MTMTLLLAAVVVLAVALAVAIVALVRGGGRHDDVAVLGDQIEDAAHAQSRAVERLDAIAAGLDTAAEPAEAAHHPEGQRQAADPLRGQRLGNTSLAAGWDIHGDSSDRE